MKEEKIMPFINSKVSVPMTGAQKESVKQKLGKAISIIPGKSEFQADSHDRGESVWLHSRQLP